MPVKKNKNNSQLEASFVCHIGSIAILTAQKGKESVHICHSGQIT